MSGILTLFASVPFLSGLISSYDSIMAAMPQQNDAQVFESVEVGIAELSPNGEEGGFAVPASGSADQYGTCDLTISQHPIQEGDTATFTWTQPTAKAIEGGGPADLSITRINSGGGNETDFGSQSTPFTDASAADLPPGDYVYFGETYTSKSVYCGRGCRETETTYWSCYEYMTVEDVGTDVLGNSVRTGVGDTNGVENFWGPFTVNQTAVFEFDVVNNTSESISSAFSNTLQIDTNGDCTDDVAFDDSCIEHNVSAGQISSMNGSETRTLNPTWTPTSVGSDYQARIYSDSGDVLDETNETNNDSTWETFVVQAQPPTVDLEISIDEGPWQDGSIFTIEEGEEVALRWDSTNADTCYATSGGGFDTGDATSGTDNEVTEPGAGESTDFIVECERNGEYAADTIEVVVGIQPGIDSDPGTVNRGDEVEITWDTNGNDLADCTVYGPNFVEPDPLTTTGSQNVQIDAESTYTIDCGSGNIDETTVRVRGQIFES